MKEQDLTPQFKLINMDKIDITTEEFPIIGTQALATCVGILLYSKRNNRAIVAHVSNNPFYYFEESIKLIAEYNLDNDYIYYAIIPGADYNHYQIKELLESEYKKYPTLFKPLSIPANAIQIDKHTNSYEFAFNALTGEFVTEKVKFGLDYIESSKVL